MHTYIQINSCTCVCECVSKWSLTREANSKNNKNFVCITLSIFELRNLPQELVRKTSNFRGYKLQPVQISVGVYVCEWVNVVVVVCVSLKSDRHDSIKVDWYLN